MTKQVVQKIWNGVAPAEPIQFHRIGVYRSPSDDYYSVGYCGDKYGEVFAVPYSAVEKGWVEAPVFEEFDSKTEARYFARTGQTLSEAIEKSELRVVISDYTNFRSSMCRNGGNYGFDVAYYFIPNLLENKADGFVKVYYTTSEFPYCPRCGTFYKELEPCLCDEYETVTAAEMLQIIKSVPADFGLYINGVELQESQYPEEE